MSDAEDKGERCPDGSSRGCLGAGKSMRFFHFKGKRRIRDKLQTEKMRQPFHEGGQARL